MSPAPEVDATITGAVMRGPDPLSRVALGSPSPGATDLSLHFEGLAHPTRLRIVERLGAAAELRVSELADLCKVSQPRMSWHLRMLRRAQLVRTRRDGREVFCSLDRESIVANLRNFVVLLDLGVRVVDTQGRRQPPAPQPMTIPVSEVAQ